MSDARNDGTNEMLQTSVEPSGAEWVVMANVGGAMREMSRHADEASAREADRELRASSRDAAAASDDLAG